MGRGIVDPVDDLRATNPASNEELIAALTQGFRRSRLRREAPDPHHHEFGRLSAFVRSQRHQSERQHLLFEVHHQAPARRSDSGRYVAGHRRAHAVFAAIRPERARCSLPDTQVKSRVPDRLRTAAAQRLRRRGALGGSHHRASAARDQRRHAEQETQRRRRLRRAVPETRPLGFENPGARVPDRVQPVSVAKPKKAALTGGARRNRTRQRGTRAGAAKTCCGRC